MSLPLVELHTCGKGIANKTFLGYPRDDAYYPIIIKLLYIFIQINMNKFKFEKILGNNRNKIVSFFNIYIINEIY